MHVRTLISAEELQAVIDDPHTRLCDCRFNLGDPKAGRAAWEQSHLPGARHVDMEADLSLPHRPGKTGRHPLPERDAWIEQVCSWGISPRELVVCYDDNGGAGASRLWWMLQWIGHDNAVVLDGGLQAWVAAGGKLDTSLRQVPPLTDRPYTARLSLTHLVQAADIDSKHQLLLDARDRARFRGENETIDPVAGHIPGALASPWTENLQADGHFKHRDALHEKFAAVAASDLQVVCYCGSGVTACHNILALVHAGFVMPSLYAGSWSEWITDTTRPVATGD